MGIYSFFPATCAAPELEATQCMPPSLKIKEGTSCRNPHGDVQRPPEAAGAEKDADLEPVQPRRRPGAGGAGDEDPVEHVESVCSVLSKPFGVHSTVRIR